ncbi:Gfo/Idh/MocA family oxidoreductase [Paenibacillus caui]|uniref:Gfo/Idh/MocA family oxidoreductase n=1 Tax=Paenibacillus caui TaxID=2873927 RepID=UPI00307FF666
MGLYADSILTLEKEKSKLSSITSSYYKITNITKNEIDHFIECIRQRKQPLSPVQDGVEVMKMLTGIYASAEKGEEIRW